MERRREKKKKAFWRNEYEMKKKQHIPPFQASLRRLSEVWKAAASDSLKSFAGRSEGPGVRPWLQFICILY